MRAAFSKVRVPDQRPLSPSYDNERGRASGLTRPMGYLLRRRAGRFARIHNVRRTNRSAFRRGRGGGNGLSDTTILKTYLRPFARAASTRASHAFPPFSRQALRNSGRANHSSLLQIFGLVLHKPETATSLEIHRALFWEVTPTSGELAVDRTARV
jgi:hypothetical protein